MRRPRQSVCAKCGEPVQFRRTKTGALMPLDPEPNNEIGNVLLDFLGVAHSFGDRDAALAFQDGRGEEPCDDEYLEMSQTYVPHFATCAAEERPAGAASSEPAPQRAML